MGKKKLPLFYDAEFVVVRDSTEEATFGVVTAEVGKKKLLVEGYFLEALRKAITRWVRNTEEGAKAWMASSEDFNLGDLSCQDTRFCRLTKAGSDLGRELAKVSIFNLRVEVICTEHGCKFWCYDTVLVDSGETPAG